MYIQLPAAKPATVPPERPLFSLPDRPDSPSPPLLTQPRSPPSFHPAKLRFYVGKTIFLDGKCEIRV